MQILAVPLSYEITPSLLSLALGITSTVFADNISSLRVIEVSGTASVTAEPDLMRWNLELVTTGDDAEKVTAQHAELLQQTLKYLDTLGLSKDAVKASQLRISDETSYVESKLRQKDIVARINVVFTTTSIEKYRDIWIALGKLKGVRIGSVEMDTSRRDELVRDARSKALLAGRKKAEEMAAVLGATVKEPLSIRENGVQPYAPANVRFKAMSADAGNEPLPGNLEISETAELTFRIE